MNQQIVLTVGSSGSGKSTWAIELINTDEYKSKWFRVNLDDIRKQITGTLVGYYERKDLSKIEKIVYDIQHENVLTLLDKGYNVVIDDTNLEWKYCEEKLLKYNHLADISFELMPLHDLGEIKERLELRDWVMKDISFLLKQREKHFSILSKPDKYVKKYPKTVFNVTQDAKLPKAVIFDIDGTIANKRERDIYDYSKVKDDYMIEPVANLVNSYIRSGYEIIFCSGRDERSRRATEDWLMDKVFQYVADDRRLEQIASLYMRKAKDTRRDSLIKRELYSKHIHGKYFVEAVYDDRLQVIEECWNPLGLFVINVNQGNIRF